MLDKEIVYPHLQLSLLYSKARSFPKSETLGFTFSLETSKSQRSFHESLLQKSLASVCGVPGWLVICVLGSELLSL